MVDSIAASGPDSGTLAMPTRSRGGTGPTVQLAMLLYPGAEQIGGRGDAHSSTLAGAASRGAAAAGPGWEHGCAAQPDRIVRFVLFLDATPAPEGAGEVQGGRAAFKRGANVTLAGDAPNDASTTGDTIAFAPKRQVLEPGGSGPVLVNLLTMKPHVEIPTQHVHGTLGVPGSDLPISAQQVLL